MKMELNNLIEEQPPSATPKCTGMGKLRVGNLVIPPSVVSGIPVREGKVEGRTPIVLPIHSAYSDRYLCLLVGNGVN